MTSDLQALLAAIIADPADDTTRLAYADCLEENGNAPRAEFIRLQVEAERHHPDSNARGAREDRARAIFEQNWREWWGEVCAAVGVPASEVPHYILTGSGAAVGLTRPHGVWSYLPEQRGVTFRRGFPESVAVPGLGVGLKAVGAYLARWANASPLTELVMTSAHQEPRHAWPEGPHLATVRRLDLRYYDADTFGAACASPNLSALDHLALAPAFDPYGGGTPNTVADDLAAVIASAHAPRLRHLSLADGSERVVELLAGAEALAGLESLRTPNPHGALASSPHLAALRKLRVPVYGVPQVVAPLLQSPAWNRLTYLELDYGHGADELRVFPQRDELANLEEFRLAGTVLTSAAVRDLARSPLLKRLKHFALAGIYNDGRALLPLVDAVDPARIETFAVAIPYFPQRAADALRAKFGDRFRVLPT